MTRNIGNGPGLPSDPDFLTALTEIDMIAHLASNEFRKLLPEGLTEAQYGVLNRLTRIDDDETISELAYAFQVAQPTMTSTIKKLEQKGLVSLHADATDARVKRIRLTRRGMKVRRETVEALLPFQLLFARDAPSVDWAVLMPSLTALRVFLEQRRYSVDA